MSKRFIEEKVVIAATLEELNDELKIYKSNGWLLHGSMTTDSLKDIHTGKYSTMHIQYVYREEPTTYNNWAKENRRVSINYTHD